MGRSLELPAAAGWLGEDCWVALVGEPADRRYHLAGSSHTHRGHFYVESADELDPRTVALIEIAEASPVARAWLSGFLQGQEPGLWEFLGSDDEMYDAYDDQDLDRWRAWAATFRSHGRAPDINKLPPPSQALREVSDPDPWVYVGGQYRTFIDGAWHVAEPQPDDPNLAGWAWPGTVCATRRYHAFAQLGDVTICEDCHEVS